MIEDQLRWNERHATQPYPDTPSPRVVEFAHLAPGKRALDVACGSGRHLHYLASLGFDALGIDLSDVALSQVRTGRAPGGGTIRIQQEDLDEFRPKPLSFDLITNIHFLNRALIPHLLEALSPRGVLVFETFVLDEAYWPQGVSDASRYLLPNELLHALLPLRILYYTEQPVPRKKNEMVVLASLVGIKE